MLHQRLDARLLKTRDPYIHQLKAMGLSAVEDLLLYFPRAYSDEQGFTRINDMRTDAVNVIRVRIKSILNMPTRAGKVMTRAVVADETGELPVLWFNQPHVKQMFPRGSEVILTGKLKFDRGQSSLASPKYEKPAVTLLHTGRLVPVYPETELISSQWLRNKIYSLLPLAKDLQDPLPAWMLEAEALMPLWEAVMNIHFPKDALHLERAKQRLGFDELFLLQFAALQRKREWQQAFIAQEGGGETADLSAFFAIVPFELTGAQRRVIAEIMEDLTRPYPMLRLVQGDVGAGKTVVAAAAIYALCSAGKQVALMAPTEILARQHYKSLMKLLRAFPWNIQLLVGSLTDGQKSDVLRQLSTGTCEFVIGTHALIQEGVQFQNLGLVVVDEQHRFGVKQREKLRAQGSPHLLNLSATPIPRTLALTLYGDQDLSILDEMPPGRQEIVTRIIPEQKRQDAYIWISDQIQKGRQVFIICPLVEESEVIEVKAATVEYERLCRDVFPQHRLALLHGRMKADEKDAVMKAFAEGSVDILVSTSVVEVGIDVPNASIMMIEGADRFGLAQLHQFRGRVGRGSHQSYCFLFSDSKSEGSLQRLKYMVNHASGFDLAELDLAMRGPGEIYGVKQSGIPDLRMATLTDTAFVERVRTAAGQLLEQDPELTQHTLLKQRLLQMQEVE